MLPPHADLSTSTYQVAAAGHMHAVAVFMLSTNQAKARGHPVLNKLFTREGYAGCTWASFSHRNSPGTHVMGLGQSCIMQDVTT